MKRKVQRFVKSHTRTFYRASLTALAATVVDYATLTSLVEFGGVYYVIATACGAFLGAITNFYLNRQWAFDDQNQHRVSKQVIRYAFVSTGSMALNTFGVFSFTEFLHLRYLISKVVTSILVGWFWNYPLHRYYVFRARADVDK